MKKYSKKNILAMTPTERLSEIRNVIKAVDGRCAAYDGPVGRTNDEITLAEIQWIYLLTDLRKAK
jgi:hypothetical protein